jgi:hypothetical protein
MTPYAMTAHLALNLVWLWLFLRDTKYSHALAVLVAFVACGLHQVVFHPLFAAPFLLSVLRARRWKLAGFYAASYAAIGIFWLLYWTLAMQGIGGPGTRSASLGVINLIVHIMYVVDHKILATIPHIGLLLFRFVAWQSPLLIPLAMVGFFVFRKQNTVIRDLALGFAVILAVLVILVPFQGHGWGYRYVHGLLGSIALLAAQGWICVTEREDQLRRHTALLAGSVALSFFVILPWYGYQARTFLLPYENAAKAIASSDAQVVIVDPVDIWYGMDLARNDPFLKNSPKIMVLGFLQEDKMRQVCRDYDTALFDRRDADRFGLMVDKTETTSPEAFEIFRDLRQSMAEIKCGRPIAPRK